MSSAGVLTEPAFRAPIEPGTRPSPVAVRSLAEHRVWLVPHTHFAGPDGGCVSFPPDLSVSTCRLDEERTDSDSSGVLSPARIASWRIGA